MKARLIIILLSLISAVSCVFDDPEKNVDLQVGDNVPNFTVLLSDGTAVSSSEMNDGVALIMFFHTGCKDCQNTLPEVQKIYDEYKDQISVLLISREQAYDEVQAYWQEKGYTLPYSPQQDRVIYNLFATSRVPRVYVCKDGKITSCYKDDPILSYDDLKADIQAQL